MINKDSAKHITDLGSRLDTLEASLLPSNNSSKEDDDASNLEKRFRELEQFLREVEKPRVDALEASLLSSNGSKEDDASKRRSDLEKRLQQLENTFLRQAEKPKVDVVKWSIMGPFITSPPY